ncbi:MAG: sulfatase-like hydrolase/transferase, partial [Verrucomicrobiia bacterium]
MKLLLNIAILCLIIPDLWSEKNPNFLIILADDCTYNDLPLYGGQNAKTPNIDRLASKGLVFNQAYLSSAMCQPSRAELYSGLY